MGSGLVRIAHMPILFLLAIDCAYDQAFVQASPSVSLPPSHFCSCNS